MSLYNRYKQTHPNDVTDGGYQDAEGFHFQIRLPGVAIQGLGLSKTNAKTDAVRGLLHYIGGREFSRRITELLYQMSEVEREFENLLKQ